MQERILQHIFLFFFGFQFSVQYCTVYHTEFNIFRLNYKLVVLCIFLVECGVSIKYHWYFSLDAAYSSEEHSIFILLEHYSQTQFGVAFFFMDCCCFALLYFISIFSDWQSHITIIIIIIITAAHCMLSVFSLELYYLKDLFIGYNKMEIDIEVLAGCDACYQKFRSLFNI